MEEILKQMKETAVSQGEVIATIKGQLQKHKADFTLDETSKQGNYEALKQNAIARMERMEKACIELIKCIADIEEYIPQFASRAGVIIFPKAEEKPAEKQITSACPAPPARSMKKRKKKESKVV